MRLRPPGPDDMRLAKKQHKTIERLNIQAHKNAINSSDKYVTETLVTFDKVSAISLAATDAEIE